MRSRQETLLVTPAIPRLVPAEIFDAFGWCPSTSLVWRSRPTFVDGAPGDLDRLARLEDATRVTADNPPGMVFLIDASCTFLPREPAGLHVPDLADGDEQALAPYAIDDATDQLYAERVEPRSILRLATSSMAGLFWGLHDWAHFHNHGPFEDHQRALTELQCDAAALVWMRLNSAGIPLDHAAWTNLRRDVTTIGRARFAELPAAPDADLLTIWTNVERYLDEIDAASG